MAQVAYWIVHPASGWISTPTGAQIKDGFLSNGTTEAEAKGSEAIASQVTQTITEQTAETLSPGTAYKVAWTVYDDTLAQYATPVVGDYKTAHTGTGALTAPVATLSGSGNVISIARAGGGMMRRTPRRSKEYEEYLRSIAEGREYVRPEDREPTPEKAPKTRPKRKRKVAAPASTLGGFKVADGLLGEPQAMPAVAIEVANFEDYRAAYEQARLAELRREDEELLLLLVA